MSPSRAAQTPVSLIRRLLPGDRWATLAAVVLDAAVVVAAFACALLLRFDGDIPRENAEFVATLLPILCALYIGGNLFFGVYRTVWAYGSVADVLHLFRAIFLVTIVLFAANFWLPDRHLPLSVILMAGALIFPGMATVKMRTRVIARAPWASSSAQRLLIVGADRTGQLLARELQNDPDLQYQPVGFLDDSPNRLHSRIHGIRVLGTLQDLASVIARRDVEVVAIALPRTSGATIRRIVGECQLLNVPVRIVPGVDNWVRGHASDALRELDLDDLLGRELVEVDYAACSASVHDTVVLVTGAAGSIGSELCRQLLTFRPRELHLLDNNESGLYDLSFAIRAIAPETILKLWVANVVEAPRIDAIFAEVRPDLVYHAAAFKHVPLMEEHPGEAFRVNAIGTLNVARAARTYQTGTFVLISTDKAVRPTSIMGATKRIAELLVLALARETELTSYAAVRFGNVMGSRGSVVPLFVSQIERGGPVTVVHPDMMRYFISIPEAVSLVIQAGTFGGHGNIYMLDMGEEVNILELAERIIRLRGLEPGRDIEVVFTGPRPGEKLREELVADYERVETTRHAKVNRLVSSIDVSDGEIGRLIAELAEISWGDQDELARRIHLVVRKFARETDLEPGPAEAQAPAPGS
ncbi:MAG: nucleoside-diphosphate sugar epimerase/dehydratase [Dehalococcoidia bacterium]